MTAPSTAELVEQEERRFLLALARYQLRRPNACVSDDLAQHSTVLDEDEREQAFNRLCSAIAFGDPAAVIEAALDQLRSCTS